jgi:hypothetical protein
LVSKFASEPDIKAVANFETTTLRSKNSSRWGGAVTSRHSTRGAWLIILASLIVMAICVYDYYTPETGLIGTGGTILVAVAGLLMLLAALVVALVPNRSGLLQGFLVVSILLDIIGSSVAGYFLESPVIMAAEALALIGWLMNVIGDAADRSVEIDEVEDED